MESNDLFTKSGTQIKWSYIVMTATVFGMLAILYYVKELQEVLSWK